MGNIIITKPNTITGKQITVKNTKFSPSVQATRDSQAKNFRELRAGFRRLRKDANEVSVKSDARTLRERLKQMKTLFIGHIMNHGNGIATKPIERNPLLPLLSETLAKKHKPPEKK